MLFYIFSFCNLRALHNWNTHKYIHTCVRAYARPYVRARACAYVCVRMCVRAFVRVCVRECIHTFHSLVRYDIISVICLGIHIDSLYCILPCSFFLLSLAQNFLLPQKMFFSFSFLLSFFHSLYLSHWRWERGGSVLYFTKYCSVQYVFTFRLLAILLYLFMLLLIT